MKKERKQPQQIFGWPDGFPNQVYIDRDEITGKWYWIIMHQNRLICTGARAYSSKANCKRGFLSFLTHAFMVMN